MVSWTYSDLGSMISENNVDPIGVSEISFSLPRPSLRDARKIHHILNEERRHVGERLQEMKHGQDT